MPVYTIICNDGGQENIVLHNQLFISEDTATQWDTEDRITSDMNLLSATDQMDLYAMGPSPYAQLHKQLSGPTWTDPSSS